MVSGNGQNGLMRLKRAGFWAEAVFANNSLRSWLQFIRFEFAITFAGVHHWAKRKLPLAMLTSRIYPAKG
jgi:hypothetical protein